MKRTTTLLICILLIITLSCSASVYAYAVTGGIARTAASDSETKETDLLDGLIIPEDEGLTVADKKALINSASLDPIVTHYAPMDKIVSEILSKIIKPNMDTYEKVIAIYDYLRDGTEYAYDFKSDAAINSMIFSAVNYKNNRDYIVLRDAYRMLTEKRGKCAHFSSAFVVLTRAIGLESYIATSTNSSTGLGGHFSSMMKLGDGLYYFDPVMGVVLEISGDMTDSCYFCYPMQNSNTNEYSYLKEQLEYFGKFETLPESVPIISNEPKGKTLGDKHFSLGSYPQTRVTDSALLEELNKQLNGVVMNQYPYSHGGGTYDSMVKSGYMSWADITYNNEKYRAVKIDDYRPKFIYTKQAKDYSMQSVTGYKPGDIYWFRFDPIEWRLTDDSNLLVADLALDSQPFNDELYLCEEGKMINGKRHYVFKDAQFTEPANDWEVSYIRDWLNDEFYNTAFTSQEKELILDTQLDPNYGDMNYFDYPGTTDKVFLLSKDEAESSEYYLAESADNRSADSTDYARSQGACSRYTKTACFGTTWLLRNPGTHSEDICVIDSKGSIHSAISAGCASTGIRPAIRVTSLNALIPETLAAPRRLTVKATDTGQITLKSAVSNGADYYKFYCYSGESVSLERTVSSEKSKVVMNDLKTGTEYRFSASAVRVDQTGKVIEESVQTTEEKQVCKTFVEPPTKLSAAPSGTGKITVSVEPVKNAVAYNIYRYVDADTAILCGTTENNKLELDGFLLGTTYAFWASSLSDDGYESDLSEVRARCLCSSVPPKPSNVTAVPAATDKITVSWDAVEGADSYNVFRYKNNELTLIGTTNNTSFTEKDLYTGNTYTYRVQALATRKKDYSVLSVSAKCKCTSIPPVPEDISLTPTKTGEMTLSWKSAEGAAKYNIYRYFNPTESVLLGSTDRTTFVAGDLPVGYNVYFQIQSVSADGKDIGAKSALISTPCLSIPAVPEGLTVQASKIPHTVTLSWKSVSDATAYRVYKYDSETNDYFYVAETDQNHIDVGGVSHAYTSSFKIAAVKRGSSGTDISALSKSVMTKANRINAPTGLTAAATATGEITLKWNPVEYADRYDISIFDAATKQYVTVGSTSMTSYAAGGLKVNTTHIFRVSAVKVDGKAEFASTPTDRINCVARSGPEPVENLRSEMTNSSVKLTWNSSNGAAKYYIYRTNITEQTPPEQIGSTKETVFTVGQLKAGTVYSFYVAAAGETNNGTILSYPSKAVTVSMPGGSTEPTSPTVISYLLGDADGNKKVDSADAVVIQRRQIKINVPISPETIIHGDIDGDGDLTIVDSTFILRYCVKADTPYPIGVSVNEE